jgi:ribonuclease E
MEETKNQRAVEDRLRDAMKMDRARIQIGRLSRFGLLEMSRQRLRPSLGESSHLSCPRCNGIGNIRSVESISLSILRLLSEDARKDRTAKLIVQVPVSVATYLMNEKREALRDVEARSGIDVLIVPNPDIETPEYSIRRVRDDEAGLAENALPSYRMPTPTEQPDLALQAKKPVAPTAAVAPIMPTTAAPVAPTPEAAPRAAVAAPRPAAGDSFWTRLKRVFTGEAPATETTAAAPARQGSGGHDRGGHRRDERGARGSGDRSRGRSRGGRGGRSDRPESADASGERPRERGAEAPPQREAPREGDRSRGRGRGGRDGARDTGREAAPAAEQREPREAREPRGPREPRPPRNDAPPSAPQSAQDSPADTTPAEGVTREPRAEGEQRRSRRGGRRRRRGGAGRGDAAGGAAGAIAPGATDDHAPQFELEPPANGDVSFPAARDPQHAPVSWTSPAPFVEEPPMVPQEAAVTIEAAPALVEAPVEAPLEPLAPEPAPEAPLLTEAAIDVSPEPISALVEPAAEAEVTTPVDPGVSAQRPASPDLA